MVKEFKHYIAWTDVMRAGNGFVGVIEYQRKLPCSMVHVLWVINPQIRDEDESEDAATAMLEQISEITAAGKVIYSDGVAL